MVFRKNTTEPAAKTNAYATGTMHLVYLTALLALIIAIIAAAMHTIATGIQIETNISSVLPKDTTHKRIQLATDKLFQQNGNRLIFIVSGNDKEKTSAAARTITAQIADSTYLSLSEASAAQDAATLIDTLAKTPFNFLSHASSKQLKSGDIQELLASAQRRLFDFSAAGGILPPAHDPLNLFNDWFSAAYTPQTNIDNDGDLSFIRTANSTNKTHIIIPFELRDHKLSVDAMGYVGSLYSSIVQSLPEGITITRSGIAFHAAETSAKAQRDMTMVATGSLIGIIGLFFLAFRSLSPLLLSLASIAFGCLSAAMMTHVIFGYLHIFTLVFGASLIGITVDYSLHFFVHFYEAKDSRSALLTLNQILPEIATGLATSVTGFACLLFSTLTNLKQISLFSIVGLISAWLIVVVLYPKIGKNTRKPLSYGHINILASAPSLAFQRCKNNTTLYLSLVIGIVLVSFLAVKTQWSSDVRMLNASSKALLREETETRQLLSLTAANQFILISGSTAEATLENEELLTNTLDGLVAKGAIGSYAALSRYIPSKRQQEKNYDTIKKNLFSSERLDNYMQDVGFSDVARRDYHDFFASQNKQRLDIDDWLSQAPAGLSLQWLGELDKQYSSIITLTDVRIPNDIAQAFAPFPFATFVDSVNNLSRNLSLQRQQASYFLIIAYGAIALILLLRYRRFARLKMLAVPILSSLLTLAALTACDVAINIFHVFGLFLILGLGMDYSIFIADAEPSNIASPVAIFLSAITSALSFGLLTFSSIPMIQAFGATILLGSLFNLALAPLAKTDTAAELSVP